MTSGGIVDTRVRTVSGEFIPIGAAVTVQELTGDHLALIWGKRVVFLLDPDREGIQRVFGAIPPPAGSDAVRERRVEVGMTGDETALSWGPPARVKAGSGPTEEAWLYSGEGSWRARVVLRDGKVAEVSWEEGEAPLVPDPYPALDPRRKRPYQPW